MEARHFNFQTMLTPDIKNAVDKSVLCWLATTDLNHWPNVSPKEIFTYFEESYILVGNILSPQTIKNIKANPQVCISFIDIFVQKGFKLKGIATFVTPSHPRFDAMAAPLTLIGGPKFPIKSLIAIEIQEVHPIIAPSYLLFPEETTEASQIESAKRTYGV